MTAEAENTLPRTLTLRTYVIEDVLVVHCTGKLTAEVTGHLKQEVRKLIPTSKKVALDLSDLTYMDSSGLGAVVGLYISAKSSSCDLRLINLNKRIRELLGMTNLLSLLESYGKNLTKLP